jgi:hypothetical protein
MYELEIRARSASVSKEKRGHSEEKEQHAPQVRHEATSGSADCFDNSIPDWWQKGILAQS